MAMAIKTKAPDAVKLFVGQIPKNMTQDELLPIFQEAGQVFEINVIRDKVTKQSRGCCFLTYSSRSEADNAIDLFHNKRSIAPLNSPLQVKYADGELERLEHKLFIGMLPKSVTESEVKALFSNYGSIKELQVIKGSQQTAKACAFLKYDTKEQASAAVDALNGIYKMEGSTSALVVKWADTEKERQARKLQKSQQTSTPQISVHLTGQPAPSFGNLPLSATQFNGYGYQASAYGVLPYSPTQALPSQPNLPPEHATAPNGYMSNGYTGQYLSYTNPFIGQAVTTYSTAVNLSNSPPVPPKTKTSSGPQAEGPPGANLFIYHIPAEFGDAELSTAFSSFGNVVSAKVFVDKTTGISKCFGKGRVSFVRLVPSTLSCLAGFVSYDSPEAAQAAINVMNGFQLSGKRLKVQLKRDNKSSKPY